MLISAASALAEISEVDAAGVAALREAVARLEPADARAQARAGAPIVTFQLDGKTLELIDVGGNTYAAEIEGERRRIRSRRTNHDVSECCGGRRSAEPPWCESETADIALLLECLAGNAKRETSPGRISLVLDVQWGHFRQNRTTRVSIEIAADGVIEIDTVVSTQDDSYY